MRFPSAELRDECENGGCTFSFSGEAPQDHARVLSQRPRKAGAGEELCRIAVIFRGGSGYYLLQGNGELVGIEGPAFTNFFSWGDDFVPGLHRLLRHSELDLAGFAHSLRRIQDFQ